LESFGFINCSISTLPRHLSGLSCDFSFNIVGGSSEEWEIELEEYEGMYVCNIERPSDSYLFFTDFSATVSNSPLAEVEVWENTGEALRNEVYEIKETKVTIAKGWQGTIRRIWLVADGE